MSRMQHLKAHETNIHLWPIIEPPAIEADYRYSNLRILLYEYVFRYIGTYIHSIDFSGLNPQVNISVCKASFL